jgi:hypothetical protein
MVLIGIPAVGTQPSQLGGVANNGQEFNFRINDNASTNVELSGIEAPNNSDHQVHPLRVTVGGS